MWKIKSLFWSIVLILLVPRIKITRVGVVDRGILNLRLKLILRETNLKEDIPLNTIINPLRYDIIIRENFIKFYLKDKDIYKKDFELFVDKALDELFYDYFKIKTSVYRPKLLKDKELLAETYIKYIKNFINLFEDIKNNGFDNDFPITLHRNIFSKKLYMGNGCSRIACLKFLGYRYLRKEQGKVLVSLYHKPKNNTLMLFNLNLINKKIYNNFIQNGI